MTRILFLSGGQRRESLNTRLLVQMAAMLKRQCEDASASAPDSAGVAGRCEIDIVRHEEIALPLFDQGLQQNEHLMQQVRDLRQRVVAADGLVIACPEHNGQLAPYLTNLVDWLSLLSRLEPLQPSAFAHRPVLLCSASTSQDGGSVVLPQARALFGHVGATVMGNTINIPKADQSWYGDGAWAGYQFEPMLYRQIDEALHQLRRLASLTGVWRSVGSP
jgi:NAD(P)H-dependent FMN reductase